MEIQVTKVVPLKDGKSLISFESSYGTAEGIWSNDLPKINSAYDVEIDFDHDFIWSVDACLISEQCPKLEKNDHCIRIVAQIDSIAEDNCCVLRIGGSILMTEIKNIPNLSKGTFVELKPKIIRLFNSNL